MPGGRGRAGIAQTGQIAPAGSAQAHLQGAEVIRCVWQVGVNGVGHPARQAQATRADRRRIKELERDLLRKDRALAETAALLVLSKKVAAIFHKGEGE